MKIKKLISVLLVISFVVAIFAVPAAAAKSGSNTTKNIYVSTKANWLKPGKESITLTQKQGVTKNGRSFSCSWSVKVYKYGSGATKYYTLSGSSLTIPLDRNSNYVITVSPTAAYKACCEINRTEGSLKRYPSWYVSKTNKISSIS